MKRLIVIFAGMLLALAMSSVSFAAQTKDCSKCPVSQSINKSCPEGIKNCPNCPNGSTACIKSGGTMSSAMKGSVKQTKLSRTLKASTQSNETGVSGLTGTVASKRTQR